MCRWLKLGQVFRVDNTNEFLKTHASNPLAMHLVDDVFRIYYSGRNFENKSSVGFVDIDIIKQKIINYPKNPCVTFGVPNSFYSHGISIGNMYSVGEKKYILFMAWKIDNNKHWRGDIGRLEMSLNSELQLNPRGAFMSLDREDQISLSYPWVVFDKNIYKMWYGSTITWNAENGEMIHVIKYATSIDSVCWNKHGVAIGYVLNDAQAFSHPCVIVDKNLYHMWYSFRCGTGVKYRIGYATSKDGINWIRQNREVGIDVSIDGWDSEMICYPFVFDHKGNRFMLYNGNDFGKTGFGLAILEK